MPRRSAAVLHALVLVLVLVLSANATTPTDLRLEYLPSPVLGSSELSPRFAWTMDCSSGCPRGLKQHGYRITVNETVSKKPAWDSGWVQSSKNIQIEYNGTALQAETSYEWGVQWQGVLLDGSLTDQSTSASASFDMGLVAESDWDGADWIGSETQKLFRVNFSLPAGAKISRARAYIAAPGCHSLYVNNLAAGDELGVCPWTQFDRTVIYQTHDILQLVSAGANSINLQLGNGMYKSRKFGDFPTAKVKITVDYNTAAAAALQRLSVVSKGIAPPPTLPPSPPPTPSPGPLASCSDCGTTDEHSNVTLSCPSSTGKIMKIIFASYGLPVGKCEGQKKDKDTFAKNPSCDAPLTSKAVEELCLRRGSCELAPSCRDKKCNLGKFAKTIFPDPCNLVKKHLSVAVECSDSEHIHESAAAVSAWEGTPGPVVSDDPFIGTTIDWSSTAEWVPATRTPADETPAAPSKGAPHGAVLRALMMPLSRLIATLTPTDKAMPSFSPNDTSTFLEDGSLRCKFERNLVGVVRLNPSKLVAQSTSNSETEGAGTGGTIKVKHGEVLLPTGEVSFPWHEEQQTDQHLGITDLSVKLQPRFTWHGFQYVQITVSDGLKFLSGKSAAELCTTPGAVTGLQIHNALERTGSLEFNSDSSDSSDRNNTSSSGSDGHMLNDIQTMVTNGQLSNCAAYQPTDCPTREKHGWLGDAQVTAEEAMLNFQMASIYTEYLQELQDAQQLPGSPRAGDVPGVCPVGPQRHEDAEESMKQKQKEHMAMAGLRPRPGQESGMGMGVTTGPDGITDISWSAAYPLITRWMLKHYGDLRIVKKHYDSLTTFMEDLIMHAAKSSTGGLPDFFTWGPALAAFNFLLAVDAMADMAAALDNRTDVLKWHALGDKLRPVFHSRFYNSTAQAYGARELELQSLTVAPLAMGDTIPAPLAPTVIKSLHADIVKNDYHFTVGSVGAKHLLPQLSGHGLHSDAMRIATQKTFPSFGYWLSKGATTCWEDYSGYADPSHPPPPTHNHIFLCGGVGEWMYRSVAGIGPSSDGYASVFVAPQILGSKESAAAGAPTSAKATLASVRGKTSVSWKLLAQDTVSIAVTVPVGATATISVPLLRLAAETATITEGGEKVWSSGKFSPSAGILSAILTEDGSTVMFVVLSGDYTFTTSP